MTFVELRSFDNYIEANIVLNRLQYFDINCHLKDENIVTIDPLLSNAIGGIKLMVHHAHVERAWNMLKEVEAEYLETIACPVCRAHSLEMVTVTKQHRSRFSAIASMLLNGHSLEVTKFYRCKECGYDFKELPSE